MRDRIAAALDASYMSSAGRNYGDWLNNAADAVIAELGLRREWLCQNQTLNQHPVVVSGNPLIRHRYVTEWE